MARPSKLTHKIADTICDRLARGESLRTICAGKDMPGMSSVMRWLGHDDNGWFREQYARAREAQAETYADQIVDIADEECTMVRADKHGTKDDDAEGNTEVVFDAVAVMRNKLRIDSRKWVAEKLAPKKYGRQQTIEHRGKVSLESLVAGEEDEQA